MAVQAPIRPSPGASWRWRCIQVPPSARCRLRDRRGHRPGAPAPAFGEEDKAVTDAAGIEAVVPVDSAGQFTTEVAPYAGMQVFGANAAGVEGRWRTESQHVLDRYVLATLHDLVVDVTARMDRYDIAGACDSVRGFGEVLTNWYVRRCRDRFWAGLQDAIDTLQDAIDTLHTVLEVTCRVAAPLLPLTTEAVWRGLTGQRSVHLPDWPDPATLPHDRDLVAAMDRVRQVVFAALPVRKSRGLRVRQPLPTLTVAAPDAAVLAPFTDLLRDEVNVRSVTLTEDVAAHGRFELTVNARACGPWLGGDTQKVIRAVKAGEWERGPDGVARDLVRVVQQARKQAALDVTDRIALTVDAPETVLAAAQEYEEFIAGEVLARRVDYGPVEDGFAGSVGDGVVVRVTVAVVSA